MEKCVFVVATFRIRDLLTFQFQTVSFQELCATTAKSQDTSLVTAPREDPEVNAEEAAVVARATTAEDAVTSLVTAHRPDPKEDAEETSSVVAAEATEEVARSATTAVARDTSLVSAPRVDRQRRSAATIARKLDTSLASAQATPTKPFPSLVPLEIMYST